MLNMDHWVTLFLMSMVVVVNFYLAQRSSNRPEIFYAGAGLMLFAALLLASSHGH